MDTKLQNSKIAFLLSSCEKFSKKFYKYILKPYEKNKIVATIHNFSLFVKFNSIKEDEETAFSIKNTDYIFYNTKLDKKNIYSEWLQLKNNESLSKKEITLIYDKLKLLDIHLDVYQFIPMLTIATLIKRYKNVYKYLFIPVVIDYNIKNLNIYHQAGLIIDFSGKILFYEPYGKYEKFNKSYKKCTTDLFSIYSSFILDSSLLDQNIMELTCITFHDYIYLNNIENNKGGIQNYIRTANNKQSDYERDYNLLIDNIRNIKNSYNKKLNNDEVNVLEELILNPLEQNLGEDNTIKSVVLLSILNNINTKNKTDDFIEEFQNIYTKALLLYYNYNSQTCVTITIYELNEFFNIHSTNINKSAFEIEKMQKNIIHEIYNKFSNSPEPNHLLLSEISNLVNIYESNLGNYNIKKILKNNNPNVDVCNKFA